MQLYSRGLARRPYKTFRLRFAHAASVLCAPLHIGVKMPA
jgi:hypothetical protein